jgi:hypothetical protein
MIKINVFKISIQEQAKIKALFRQVQVIGFIAVFNQHFSVANDVQVITHIVATRFNSLDFLEQRRRKGKKAGVQN